jgi:hypothetical protein
MNKNDRDALALAVSRQRARKGRVEQIENLLVEDPEHAATFAAYSCQCAALDLKPWERPPCHADERDSDEAARLLRQMLALGISRYHPDPLAAIAAVKVKEKSEA